MPLIPYPYRYDTEDFEFYYTYRSPFQARLDPLGYKRPLRPVDGVPEFDYVRKFASFLEQAWRFYSLDLNLQMPERRAARNCEVYFVALPDGVDGMSLSPPEVVDVGSILVKSRYEIGDGPYHAPSMASSAAHELFHLVQYVYRPPASPQQENWDWWAEASAVYMERECFPGVFDYTKFLYHWLDGTSVSLESETSPTAASMSELKHVVSDYPVKLHRYGGVLFCEFLAERYDRRLILDTWRCQSDAQTPFRALENLLSKRGVTTPIASTEKPDIFASEFLVGNFFLAETYNHGSLYQHLFDCPFVREVFSGYPSTAKGELDALSSDYFLAELPGRDGNVDITLTVFPLQANLSRSPVKTVIVPISGRRRLENQQEIIPVRNNSCFTGSRSISNSPSCDAILIVVANATWGDGAIKEAKYKVEVK